jgi:DNA transformation protein
VKVVTAYPNHPTRLRDLNGFGPRSEEILADLGIHSVEEFMAIDPYDLYAQIRPIKGMGLNSIYAIIGARENLSWLEIANTRKTEVLMRLDDLGLAPK